jgi:hypothetical protein
VLVTDRAQLLEVADRGDQHTRRPGDRFDDHGRDRARPAPRDDVLQRLRQVRAPRRLPPAERVVREVMRMRQVVDVREQLRRELFLVPLDPTDRDPAEADPVVAALPADEHDP